MASSKVEESTRPLVEASRKRINPFAGQRGPTTDPNRAVTIKAMAKKWTQRRLHDGWRPGDVFFAAYDAEDEPDGEFSGIGFVSLRPGQPHNYIEAQQLNYLYELEAEHPVELPLGDTYPEEEGEDVRLNLLEPAETLGEEEEMEGPPSYPAILPPAWKEGKRVGTELRYAEEALAHIVKAPSLPQMQKRSIRFAGVTTGVERFDQDCVTLELAVAGQVQVRNYWSDEGFDPQPGTYLGFVLGRDATRHLRPWKLTPWADATRMAPTGIDGETTFFFYLGLVTQRDQRPTLYGEYGLGRRRRTIPMEPSIAGTVIERIYSVADEARRSPYPEDMRLGKMRRSDTLMVDISPVR